MKDEDQELELEIQGGGNLRSYENNREVSAYAAQCSKCSKWRLISTLEEYEEIREASSQKPWFCENKGDKSCEDPSDIDIDNTRIWALDKPNLPKSPPGFERGMTIRKDCTRLDVYYEIPNGKKLRSTNEVQKFLEANPDYKAAGITISDFNFRAPRVLEDTIPEDVAANSKKKMKASSIVVDDDFVYDY